MRYVTSVERIGLERGRMEGREEGREEGRQEGREEGRQEGEARALEHRAFNLQHIRHASGSLNTRFRCTNHRCCRRLSIGH